MTKTSEISKTPGIQDEAVTMLGYKHNHEHGGTGYNEPRIPNTGAKMRCCAFAFIPDKQTGM
jgi:hypothetical protein